jgi:glycosyltransferase involved in cell wall biosynthesis
MATSSTLADGETADLGPLPLKVLLLEPFPSRRWISIIRYCEAIAERAPFADVKLATAIAPWWNPLSVVDGTRRRWTTQEALTARHDVVHLSDQALGHHVSRFGQTPTVVTCHDLMPFVVGDFYRQRRRGAMKRRLLGRSIAGMLRASRIIAVSNCTAEDLIRRFGYPRSRISIVPNMVGGAFAPVSEPEAWLASHGVTLPGGKRILSVGHCGGYKNIERLIDALGAPALREAWLVRVGGPMAPVQWQRAERLGVNERIIELGRVPTAVLARVYSACDVLAQPSVYEGFGVPVIEAMACGLPVVCSDGGALPEVAGDAALVVKCSGRDRAAAGALADALTLVLSDTTLRDDLRARGLVRAEHYRPENVLPQLVAAYHTTANGN